MARFSRLNLTTIRSILIGMKTFSLLYRFVCCGILALASMSAMPFWELHQPLRRVPNSAFQCGEDLSYTVRYGFITAGEGSFRIRPQAVERGSSACFDVNFEVRSLKSLEWIYRVHDTYRTLIDTAGIYPVFFEQHNREGGYKRDYWAEFDHARRTARTSEGEFPIEPFTHDVVSALFFVRTLDLSGMKKGDVIALKNFTDRQSYALNVRILGRESITVEAGTFRCIAIEPLVVEGGLFKSDGQIVIWLSDDARKMPVKVATKVLIGSIDVELKQFQAR